MVGIVPAKFPFHACRNPVRGSCKWFDLQNVPVFRPDFKAATHSAVRAHSFALKEGKIPLNGCALLVSGRGGFEIIQKALVAGIPLLASISAPSSLAVQLARELGLTMVGFLRGERFVIYAGEERLGMPATAMSAEE